MGREDVVIFGEDVTLNEIMANQQHYVLQNRFDDIALLDHFDRFSYLHMNGEPLGDYDPRYAELVAYLEKRGVALQIAGASGHATTDDLLRVAAEVNAKVTLPWHSFKPEREAQALHNMGLETYLPKKGEMFTFE